MIDTIIRGGLVVAPDGARLLDVAISGEQIAALIEPGGSPDPGATVIDATDKIVIPGGIDPHAHSSFRFVYPWAQEEGIVSGSSASVSRACAWGGTTTFVDFANWGEEPDLGDAVTSRNREFSKNSYVDYSFHIVLSGMGDTSATDLGERLLPLSVIEQIQDTVRGGFPSFKVWTTNTTLTRPKQRTDFGTIFELMTELAAAGGILAVHAEDEDLVMHASRRQHEINETDLRHMPTVHSSISEDLAVRRTIRMAEWTGGSIYLMHLSAKEALSAVRDARSRSLPVYAETLHHYASFDSSVYERDDGPLFHTYPSLKATEDNDALWAGLIDGTVSTVATDAIVCSRDHKMGGRTIEETVGGSPAVEERVGVMYSEGVTRRGMSLERFVDVTSTNAARILGLYPRKGVLASGSDADITILDPTVDKPLAISDLHEVDHSVWAGTNITAWPVTTFLRGKLIVHNGKLLGELTDGRLIADRALARSVHEAPSC